MKRGTIRIRSRQVLLVMLGLCIALAMATPALAANLYEHHNTGPTGTAGIYANYWWAQTFTPSVAHTVTSVRLMLGRGAAASPGTVTVGIRNVDGSGLPTGSDLCSGTIDGNTLATAWPYAWYDIALGGGYGLSAGTTYAMVVRAPSAVNSTHQLLWGWTTADVYAGGWGVRSTNGGTSWILPGIVADMQFEEWGTAGVGWEVYPANRARVLLPWIALLAALVAGTSLVVLRRRRARI
jgi:hypothetical protein